MSGVTTFKCTKCGAAFFPRRLLCLRCECSDFVDHVQHEAVVEEISEIHHMIGQADWKPRRIAAVRTNEGLLMTVGLQDDAKAGDRIVLSQDGTAPFGRKK